MSRKYKYFVIIIISFLSIWFADKYLPKCFAENIPKVDKIIVYKSQRSLVLLKNSIVIKSYTISLGKNPVGDKEMEGDSKTPEGKYLIDWKNKNSKYHLSLHISYPDSNDVAISTKKNQNPGGNIMIHGRPNYIGWFPFIFENRDWTDGCIALTNIEVEEIWNSVNSGTKIIIKK
jgi:murein L,D-transpeptidase YafK